MLVVLLAGTSAAAQELAAPAVEGQGVAIAPDRKAELHVGIEAGAGLDTNPYSTPLSRNVFAGDLTARLRPSASVDYPGSLLAFKGEGALEYGFLPGILGNANTQQFLLYQSLLSGDLEVNRDGMFRFAVGDSFSWNSDPGNLAIGSVYNRIQNQMRAGLGVKPGGGALTFKLGYSFDFAKFLDVEGNNNLVRTGQLDSMLHSLALRADYKFLPRTGGFLALSGGWTSYPFDAAGVNDQAFPVSAQLGVQGQIFAKVGGLASVGYSNPLVLDQGAIATGALIGVVGQAELRWQPSLSTTLGGGFRREFSPTPLYQYVGNNRFYVSLSQVLGGRFHLSANSGYSILEFGEEQTELSTATTEGFLRLDGHLDVSAALAYYITDWLAVGINDKLDWRVTNAAAPAGDNYGFVRNQTLVTLAAKY